MGELKLKTNNSGRFSSSSVGLLIFGICRLQPEEAMACD